MAGWAAGEADNGALWVGLGVNFPTSKKDLIK